MSEVFYKTIRALGRPVFNIASQPLILHAELADQPGPYVLVANHESAFDAALLIATTPRVIYWLSIVEAFRNPLSRLFLSSMCALPLDRGKRDIATLRAVTRELRAKHVIGLFPEGNLRPRSESVLEGGAIHEGVARLAQLANVPVLPCVVLGGSKFLQWRNWLPLRRTRWAVAYGELIWLGVGSRAQARSAMMEKLRQTMIALYEEIRDHVPQMPSNQSVR